MRVSRQAKERFQRRMFSFYERSGRRELPWRRTVDRYAVLVSEVMLQQTQVERVVPKYVVWLERFPDARSLAKAPLADVLGLWSGLGYNSRAKRLQDAAKLIVTEHGGVVPRTADALQALPGIGPYTARSVLIFADNADLATVDTNIRRILIHEFKLPESVSDKELFLLAETMLPAGRSRDWHNALMDYGATSLTSKRCGIRPKTRQGRFEGSRRWYRGAIVRRLTGGHSITLAQAKKVFAQCPYELEDIFEELVSEGLLVKKGRSFMLAT